MSSSSRPWDRRAASLSATPLMHSHLSPGPPVGNSVAGGGGRPRLPPKQDFGSSMNISNNYQGFSSPMNSFGYGGIGSGYTPSYGYGGYGNYGSNGNSLGMYGNRIGSYGNNLTGANIDRSSFIEEAEESSREAFDSIASIVRAFNSVTMMLESTFQAVYSSFNAVLSVADHFSQLKSHFGQIFSILTMIRSIKWIHRKLFYLLGLRKVDPSTETVWAEAKSSSVIDSNGIATGNKSSWPILIFLSALYLAPFLIWRCLSSLMKSSTAKSEWITTENESDTVGICIFDYQAQNNDELSVSCGDIVKLAPKQLQKDSNWPLVCLGSKKGKVPINYFNIRKRGPTMGSTNHLRNDSQHAAFQTNSNTLKIDPEIHKAADSSRRKNVLLSHQRASPIQELPNTFNTNITDDSLNHSPVKSNQDPLNKDSTDLNEIKVENNKTDSQHFNLNSNSEKKENCEDSVIGLPPVLEGQSLDGV